MSLIIIVNHSANQPVIYQANAAVTVLHAKNNSQ